MIFNADSVTDLDRRHAGDFISSGSHGGIYSAQVAAYWDVGGIVFNNAGIGLDEAGIAGLSLLDNQSIPAAAVSHTDARIGSGESTRTATIRHVNATAETIGCRLGEPVNSALERFYRAGGKIPGNGTAFPETQAEIIEYRGIEVSILDSASMVSELDQRRVVVTGSHGGCPGGQPERALKTVARGAVFNDAGGGPDGAGRTRLSALDRVGVPAVTVSEKTARIGDGHSTFHTGRVVHANYSACRLAGVHRWMSVVEFVEVVSESIRREATSGE